MGVGTDAAEVIDRFLAIADVTYLQGDIGAVDGMLKEFGIPRVIFGEKNQDGTLGWECAVHGTK